MKKKTTRKKQEIELDKEEYRAAIFVLFKLMKRDGVFLATVSVEGDSAKLSLSIGSDEL